jgi:hypothetical protein
MESDIETQLDLKLIMAQTQCSYERCFETYINHNRHLLDTILCLTSSSRDKCDLCEDIIKEPVDNYLH